VELAGAGGNDEKAIYALINQIFFYLSLMEKNLEQLLSKLDRIILRQELSSPSESFNIFRILRQESDEVNLHSRFLYELLNPQGSHGEGPKFLEIFAQICNLPALSYGNVRVFREHANIDILIQDNQRAIVIENKIYAGDQHEQLKRYYEYAANSYRKPTLIYLTLDGKEPSNWSVGTLQESVQLISYAEEIDRWLSECIRVAAIKPGLRETLIQYQNTIHRLTGKNMSDTEKKDVIALMAQDDNAEKAEILNRNWGHVRWHTEWDFWNELAAIVEKTHTTSPGGRYSADALDRTVHGRRNRSPWYGLSIVVGELDGGSLHLRLERNEGPMYYGFPYCSDDATIRTRMRRAIQPLVSEHTQSWSGLKVTDAGIDFEGFSNSITLQLANPEKRKRIIENLWQEMQDFICQAADMLKLEFGNDFTSYSQNELAG
jgi:hypothetical protein